MSLKSSYVCETCLHFWQTRMLVSWPPKIKSTKDVSGSFSSDEEPLVLGDVEGGGLARAWATLLCDECADDSSRAFAGVIVFLRLFFGGGRGCLTLMIFGTRLSGEKEIQLQNELTSSSSIRIASNNIRKNSWASCWAKSRYWSYFLPNVPRRYLECSQREV